MDIKIIISSYLQSIVSIILLRQYITVYEKNSSNFTYIIFSIAKC